jgi:hypothetical protein
MATLSGLDCMCAHCCASWSLCAAQSSNIYVDHYGVLKLFSQLLSFAPHSVLISYYMPCATVTAYVCYH